MNDENQYLRPPPPLDTGTRASWQRRLLSRRTLVIVAVLAGLALLAWILTPKASNSPSGRAAFATGPMPVVVATAQTGDMPIVLSGLGAVTPLATVTVQSQISGMIMKIWFKEGQAVKAGDPLIQIDPRPYQVALEQAQGALLKDKALLDNANVDLDRYQTLWKQDSIAEQLLATQKSLVIQYKGNVVSDQAQIDAQKLNLYYAHITSPIAGRVGLQQVNVGNYVTPAEPNGLAVITQMQPITVVFTLPEDQVQSLLAQMRTGTPLAATAYDRTDTSLLATGTLQSLDSQIDNTTGTVRLKASFPNSDEKLFPQQFVNVRLLLDTLHGATLIPQAAIQRGAPGTFVYVVNADQTVNVRVVTLGPGDPTNVSITKGLKPGETVVVDGADKLRDGAKVSVRQPGAATGSGAATPGTHSRQGQGQGQHSGQGHRNQQQQQGSPGN